MLCFRARVVHATDDGVSSKGTGKAILPLANPIPETPNSGSSPSAHVRALRPAPKFAPQHPTKSQTIKPELDGCPNLTDNTLAISAFVLEALQRASQIAPVPFLQMAASMALSIVQQAQGVRGIKDDFQRLAKDACDLVYVALVAHEAKTTEGSDTSNGLDSNLGDLVKTLTSIDEYARKKATQSSMKRFLMFRSDIAKINEYRGRLSHALNIFWLQSSIHVREQLAHITVQQDVMPIHDHNDPQSHLTRRRIGADNNNVFNSFDEADIGNTTNIQATGDIASGNTDLTGAFNKAQIGNIIGPCIKQASPGTSTDQTYVTAIASDNHHLHDVFEGAVIGNISVAQSSTFIASGNKNMSRSFNGARIGGCSRA